MRASQVRERILKDHEYLRGLLEDVDEQACRVARGAGEGVGLLRALGQHLLQRFGEHLDLEDRFLAPALRCTGAAGRERAEQLGVDHREQRELLDYLLEKVRDPSRPAAVLAAEWRSFVELLLEDMAREELTILEEELLRDSPPVKPPAPGLSGSRGLGR